MILLFSCALMTGSSLGSLEGRLIEILNDKPLRLIIKTKDQCIHLHNNFSYLYENLTSFNRLKIL